MLDAKAGTPRAASEARTTWPPSNARSAQHRKERSYPRDLSASPQLLEIPASRFDPIPPGSPPKLDWWFPPGAVRTTPARRTRRHEPPAGLEHNPADDEVSEDLARLRDLAPQHRPPVGQAVADLALQARDLVAADPRGLVQLTLTVTKPDGSTFVTGGF